MMLRKALVVVVACTFASACGGTKGESASPKPVHASASPAASPTVAATDDLKTVCPRVEASLPADLMVPTREQLVQIHNDLMEIQKTADLEANNAMNLFMRGIDDAAAAYNDSSNSVPGLAASEAFDNGLSAFAARCKAAGSTALQ